MSSVLKATVPAPDARASFKKAVEAAGIFPRNGPDPTSRSWGHSSSGITFAAQSKLPKLPLPSLEHSCQRYLDVLKPLQTTEEQEDTAAAVKNFISGEGPTLQAQLEVYDSSHANYMEHFWYECFLGDDDPVVLNSNAFCVFTDDPTQSRNGQITRAASLVRSTLAFAQATREDQLPPDDSRGMPLDMNQYWWLFGVTRVPAEDGGRIRHSPDSKHIIVLCRGQFYRLDVLNEKTNQIISEHELSENLDAIITDAWSTPPHEASKRAIGLLTTENQKVWSHCRSVLVQEGLQNGRNFGVIDSSLFALCLDDSAPKSSSEICRNMICGTNEVEEGAQVGSCINRWYDKLSIIVCTNGKAGMNFEHTCTDGSVDIRMACDIYMGSIAQPEAANGVPPKTVSKAENVQKLDWDINPEIQEALRLAEAHLVDRIERHQLETLDFGEYGKSYMKSMGFPPDAFFQMALQAAYCRTYGHVENGFEPVQMRQYQHGRTDVVRTTTLEAKAWAIAFCKAEASAAEKVEAMRRAVDKHVALSKSVAAGGGQHRHLFVLHQMWKRRQAFLEAAGLDQPTSNGHVNGLEQQSKTATIFTDPGWARLGTTILMGSNVENPCLAYAGFGPASDNAFTVCYFIRQDQVVMSVTSRNGQAKQFAEAIRETLAEIRRLLESVVGKA